MERLDHGPPPPADDRPAQLSMRSFLLALAITLAVFAFANPIWRAEAVTEWDQNIWWSYAPIPALVAALLALERKLCWGAFVLDTMRLTLVKFAITFLAANAMWAVWGPPSSGVAPTPPAPRAPGSGLYVAAGAPEPSPIDPARTAVVTGLVRDDAGAPVAGALVAVTGGLHAFHFAVPDDAVRLVNDGSGFRPALAVVQAHRTLELVSADGELHTAVFTGPGEFVLNQPVLPAASRTLRFPRARGLLRLSCSVHTDAERDARVLVLHHPFAVTTDAAGRFRFEGVPAEELTVSVWGATGAALTRTVSTVAGEASEVLIELPGA